MPTMVVVFLSDISWWGLYQRPHHLIRAVAGHHTILWIEPATLLERWRWMPKQVEQNIFVMSLPAVPYNARHAIVRVIAKSLSRLGVIRKVVQVFQSVLAKKALAGLRTDKQTIGLIIHNYHFSHLLDALKPEVVMYDYIDNVFGFTPLPGHVRREWEQTVRQADVVTVTSPVLERQIRTYRNENIHYIGNGVEFDTFSKIRQEDPIPPDVPTGRPIVGYIGSVYPWLDYDLLEYVCSTKPGMNFVFVGRIHPDISGRIRRLREFHNVHFLGFKPYREIPQYLARFDVAMIPFQKNELTAAVNPVKLYEYSAAGKPTVATDFSEDILQYRDIILIASTREDFASAVDSAMQKNRDAAYAQSLRAFARQHDWSKKTSRFIELMNQQLVANKPQS